MFHGLTSLLRPGGVRAGLPDHRPGRAASILHGLRYLLIAVAVAMVCQKVFSFFGPAFLLILLVVATVAILYAAISFRSLVVPFLVLIASVSLLRFVWAVHVPVLPDMFLDRISLVWMLFIFFGMKIYQRKGLRGPFAIDYVMIIHSGYIMARVLMTSPAKLNIWLASLVTPYLVFMLAKNIVVTHKQMRAVLALMAVLSFYFTVTSISEKFHLDFLLYPTIMREPHPIAAGRSSGPFRGPGIFGDTMGMLLPVFLFYVARTRQKVGKIAFGVIFMFGTLAILFTYTRGSWLASLLGLGAVVLTGRKAYLRYVIPALVVAPILAIALFGIRQDKFLEERIGTTETAESRAGNLVTALRLWRDYPIFGVGPYQFQEHSSFYVGPVELPFFGTMRVVQFRGSPAHDMYLSPLAEDGAVGLLLQLLVHFMVIRESLLKLQLRRQGDYFATYILPLFFGIYVVYLFGGFIVSFRYWSVLGSLYYMGAGITYGYRPEDAEASGDVDDAEESTELPGVRAGV